MGFQLGFPLVSEMAIRKCIQLAAQQGLKTVQYNCLIRLALMSAKCFNKDNNERWFNLASEAIALVRSHIYCCLVHSL